MDVSASVSPRELDLQNDSTYHDLALANYYGFNEDTAFDYESGSESSSESDNDDSKDPEDDEEVEKSAIATSCDASISSVNFPMLTTETIIADDVIPIAVACKENPQQLANLSVPVASRDPNKRRMEEDLVTRISNDLGPEHMSGLFRILKGGHEEEEADEVEEMEVDLSSLDEATLVEVYQYVESCCMQTMASILAAEQRERAALEKQKQCSAERTPELSCDPSSSSSLSSSPSPSHPSSHPVSPRSRRSSHSCHSNRKRNGVVSSLSHHDSTVTELQDALWNVVASAAHHPYKPRRKRSNTSAGRRSQETQMQIQQTARSLNSEETLVLCAVKHDLQGNEMEMGEDDAEIDIVGI
ncbi:hypothetical protein BCR41DRAFT_351337 [Lobosporangium transversale]|uniref:NET domain-containing protein n=1 Tax=Lobosporangium transversale TaxID=64571 RepID=A0A1Y2GRH9_9FUNG|nr:hypothetical protein BCR41DRAFT_351337 [Lobosporangium transversale]ORZ20123.1 hypothetical protein BCR41DRAFT_351337 [Lobosporangium transversale]|eukprot:XP_021882663.1 hypothetical protein BCR41DRAFT_351337 [Lobosporangium transversale]